MYIEYKTSRKTKKVLNEPRILNMSSLSEKEDSDVINERQRVAEDSSDAIVVRGVRKEYPNGKRDIKVGNKKK